MSNAQIYDDALTLPGALRAVRRHAKKVIATFVVLVALTTLLVTNRPRAYESSAKLFVRIGRETVSVDPTAAASGQVITIADTQEREIRSIVSLLANRDLLEQVVDDLGPDAVMSEVEPTLLSKVIGPIRASIKATLISCGTLEDVSDREKAIRSLAESLTIEAEKDSAVIRIAVEANTPDLAQTLVSKLVDSHLAYHLQANSTPGTLPFFSEQTERLLGELDAASDELTALKNANSVASIEAKKEALESQMQSLNEKRSSATTGLASTSSTISALQEQLANESELIPETETVGMANSTKAAMRQELYRLQILESELLAKYTSAHPQVTRIRDQIAQARAVFEQEEEQVEMTTGTNEVYQQLRMNLLVALGDQAALESELHALESETEKLNDEIARVNAGERELVSLQRNVDMLDTNYRRYVDNLEMVRIHKELESNRISNVNVVQKPSYVDYPVGPGNLVVLILGVIASFFCACGLAVMCEMMSPQPTVLRRPAGERYRQAMPPAVEQIDQIEQIDEVKPDLESVEA